MKITVYLTGGIACYKAVQVVRDLEKMGNEVRVVMTKNAEKFVSSQTLAALTKAPVLDDLWQKDTEDSIPHIHLARWTELAVVVPATANFIAKMANGIADDAASTTILATDAKKIVIPAMNDQMWNNAATKKNVAFLKKNNIHFIEPVTGLLAEGYVAKGRMPEVNSIVEDISRLIHPSKKLVGKKIVITAGGTREAIDPVRYIGNRSSGKMGTALAEVAQEAGAEVTLIYGSVSVELPTKVNLVHVEDTEEMLEKVREYFAKADVLIMAAAVADWKLEKVANQKLKKKPDQQTLTLNFVKTPDILLEMGLRKRANQTVIGFAAETTNLLENASKKLQTKHADYIIANNVSADRFGSDKNKAWILDKKQKVQELPRISKKELARKILKLVE